MCRAVMCCEVRCRKFDSHYPNKGDVAYASFSFFLSHVVKKGG